MCLLLNKLNSLKSFKIYNCNNGYMFNNYKYNKKFYLKFLKPYEF